jgi:hypothetical protein
MEMKRQIICKNCQKKFPLKSYDGEWGKRLIGKAKTNFICDLCGTKIEKNETCFADSMGLNSQEYYSWEHDSITEE